MRGSTRLAEQPWFGSEAGPHTKSAALFKSSWFVKMSVSVPPICVTWTVIPFVPAGVGAQAPPGHTLSAVHAAPTFAPAVHVRVFGVSTYWRHEFAAMPVPPLIVVRSFVHVQSVSVSLIVQRVPVFSYDATVVEHDSVAASAVSL